MTTFVPEHLLVLIGFTVVNFIFSNVIKGSRLLLTFVICLNLALLLYYKYIVFIFFNILGLEKVMGAERSAFENIIIPLGLSFYIFEVISYHVDRFKGLYKAKASFIDFSLYVAFFPRLAAGPIIRPIEFLPQLARERFPSANEIHTAFLQIVVGLFQKVVLADNIFAPIADKHFTENSGAIAGALAFTGQIFCDFNGYSLCAIGIAAILGFKIPQNFNSPYTAILFSDFWRRWHISLSTWLRDYLYIPLGGNRYGYCKTYLNLIITMTLGGLWHGASWNFILWGLFHGALLIAEKILYLFIDKAELLKFYIIKVLLYLFTIYLLIISWIIFRTQDLSLLKKYLIKMHTHPIPSGNYFQTLSIFLIFSIMIFSQYAQRIDLFNIKSIKSRSASQQLSYYMLLSALISLITIFSFGDEARGFIYFQF